GDHRDLHSFPTRRSADLPLKGGRGRSRVQRRRDIFSLVCSSLQSLLCLFERNIALQPKIQGNLGELYEQNDVSVSKVQFRFKVFIPRIPSVFRYRGKSLALTDDARDQLASRRRGDVESLGAFAADLRL